MAGTKMPDGTKVPGIEDYLPESQYEGIDKTGNPEHFRMVFEDIVDGWNTLSQGGKFHAILATRSIPEAITYYRMFRDGAPRLKVTALFDPNIGNGNPDNPTGTLFKEDGLVEVLDGYAKLYPGREYSIPTHAQFKRDVAARLAHKAPHTGIGRKPEEKLDLLIVVNQMLTGFDSKWVNTLYLDKVLEYEGLIQAFSRTNRLFGPDKPFGVIRYYRRPHTMRRNIEDAVRLYSGDKPFDMFVEKLESNLQHMNQCFADICALFSFEGIENFEHIPRTQAACAKFAKLFKQLSDYLEAAKIQGFTWNETTYEFTHEDGGTTVTLGFGENDYLVLALRYKELFQGAPGEPAPTDIPFDIDGYLTEIDTGRIDTDYMNENFQKWLKQINLGQEATAMLEQLHGSFSTLTQEQQRCGELVIHAAQNGTLEVEEGKTFLDYINDFQRKGKNGQIARLVEATGVDETMLRDLIAHADTGIDKIEALKASCDRQKTSAFFAEKEGKPIPPFRVSMKLDKLLREFIEQGGFDI